MKRRILIAYCEAADFLAWCFVEASLWTDYGGWLYRAGNALYGHHWRLDPRRADDRRWQDLRHIP